MIPIRCCTNLDLFNEKWPSYLPAIPSVGDYIQSFQKWGDGFRLTLEVYSITWVPNAEGFYTAEIDLHIRKGSKMSIIDFYNWYAPKVGRSPSAFV